MPEASSTAKLLFITTADTEILAAAKATGLLPEGFPEVLCANPATLEDPGSFFDEALPGARAVLVRLLGLRRGGGARRGAHGPLDRALRRGGGGVRVPQVGWGRQHREPAALRRGYPAPGRLRLRAPGARAGARRLPSRA